MNLVTAAIRGVRPARTPIFDLLRNTAVIEYFGGHALDGSDDEGTVLRSMGTALDACRSLGLPAVDGTTWYDGMGNLRIARRWTQWIQRRALTTEEEWKTYIEEHLQQWEDESFPGPLARAQAAAGQQALNGFLNGTVYIHCTPSTSASSALLGYGGVEMFSYLWADYPELVLRLVRAQEHRTDIYIELSAHSQTSPLAMIYSDIAYKERLILGKHTLMQLGFFDDVARICERCHAKGLAVIFHSDGDVMDVVDDLIAAGIDGLNPLEKAAGMDVYALRRRYPHLTLVGGVDVTHLLPFGTPEEVRRETRRMINELGSEGHLLIGSSTELGDDVPLANYLALHDEALRG